MSVVKSCVLPQDQAGTLAGHWRVTPVPVALHQGDWSSTEIAAISAAADGWNTFYNASLGFSLINYKDSSGNVQTSATGKPGSICAQNILPGSATTFTGSVVVYKDAVWPYPNLPSAIALTTFCPAAASPLPNIYMAVMELNYQNFFVSGQKVPDLHSILLHEFGHLAGLGHSCEASAKTGVPGCSDASINPDYTAAVMAPVFGFDSSGYGEQKRVLTTNDEGRGNCLYQNGTTAK